MKKEDLDFLKELQHELNTQETDSQASPRFWGIMEKHEVLTLDGEGEPRIYDGDTVYTLKEYVDEIQRLLEDDELYQQGGDVYDAWQDTDKEDPDDVVEFANDNEFSDYGDAYVEWVTKEDRISESTGCFLTKRAAKKHIELNGYHYNEPRTYAMTAWRNPEFERFMRIFQELDLDSIKVEENVIDDISKMASVNELSRMDGPVFDDMGNIVLEQK